MFRWDGCLRLNRSGLAIDATRRQPAAFVSHAHTDHAAPHELALCTPATARLYRARYGRRRAVVEMPYRQPLDWSGQRLTALPAGHCLGSAMLLAEDECGRLLYTGDFKLGASATAEAAELPRADVLVIESTFGDPRYRLPPRDEATEQLLSLVDAAMAADRTVVVEAYPLGKAQEVTAIFNRHGLAVCQHRLAFELSTVYAECGVDLGPIDRLKGPPRAGEVTIVPPGTPRFDSVRGEVRIAVTGWALDPAARFRLRVDHAVPLSDHADYDELIEAVGRIGPRQVYCTHGTADFAARLCALGFDAKELRPPTRGLLG